MTNKPTNLIVLDEQGNIYYSAEKVIEGQTATFIDLFRGQSDHKAFEAKVKYVEDEQITIDIDNIKPIKLYEPETEQVKGIPVRNTTEAIGVITNQLQRDGLQLNEFEVHQEKHANGYYFVAFTGTTEEPDAFGSGDTYKWRLDKASKILIEEAHDKDKYYRDGVDIAENGKKVDHQKLFQERER